jgi:hypothetical protein
MNIDRKILLAFEEKCEQGFDDNQFMVLAASGNRQQQQPGYRHFITVEEFTVACNQMLNNGDPFSISFNDAMSQGCNIDLNAKSWVQKGLVDEWHIGNFNSVFAELCLRGLNIGNLTISSRSNAVERCCVGRMYIDSRTGQKLVVSDSLIGTLHVTGHIDSLKIVNSRIQAVETTSSHEFSVAHDLIFDGVSFETSSKSKIFRGTQEIRNIRIVAEKMENSPAVALLRTHELRAERENDRGVTWLMNWLYDKGSVYGTNPTRPLMLAFILTLMAAAILAIMDGGMLPLDESLYVGWRE